MARGITESDVHTAADELVAGGDRPTVERIRTLLPFLRSSLGSGERWPYSMFRGSRSLGEACHCTCDRT